jgi:hypothetical protein
MRNRRAIDVQSMRVLSISPNDRNVIGTLSLKKNAAQSLHKRCTNAAQSLHNRCAVAAQPLSNRCGIDAESMRD